MCAFFQYARERDGENETKWNEMRDTSTGTRIDIKIHPYAVRIFVAQCHCAVFFGHCFLFDFRTYPQLTSIHVLTNQQGEFAAIPFFVGPANHSLRLVSFSFSLSVCSSSTRLVIGFYPLHDKNFASCILC